MPSRARCAFCIGVLPIVVLSCAQSSTPVDQNHEPRNGNAIVLSADTLVLIDQQPYGRMALRDFLGAEQFADEGEAEAAIQHFVDRQLVLKAAAEIEGVSIEPQEPLAQIVDRLVANAGGVAEISDAEIDSYYESHRTFYVRPRQARVGYFQVVLPEDPVEESRLARSLIVRSQIAASVREFEQLFETQHPDPVTTRWMGRVACGPAADSEDAGAEPPAEVVEVACALSEGATSAPITTPKGTIVVRNLSYEPERNVPLTGRLREELRSDLWQHAIQERRRALLEELRQDADVQISPTGVRQLVRRSDNDALQNRPTRPPQPPGQPEAQS